MNLYTDPTLLGVAGALSMLPQLPNMKDDSITVRTYWMSSVDHKHAGKASFPGTRPDQPHRGAAVTGRLTGVTFSTSSSAGAS